MQPYNIVTVAVRLPDAQCHILTNCANGAFKTATIKEDHTLAAENISLTAFEISGPMPSPGIKVTVRT